MKKLMLLALALFLCAFDGPRLVHFQIDGLGGVASVPASEGERPLVFVLGDDRRELLNVLQSRDTLGFWLDLDVAEKSTDELAADFEAYRFGLNRWLNGEAPELGESLFGKGSFSQVVLIGCNESSEAVLEIARQQHGTQMEVARLILVAPKCLEPVSEKRLPDVETALVLPSSLLEENLVALTYFNSLRQDRERLCASAILFAQTPDEAAFENFAKHYLTSQFPVEPFQGNEQLPVLTFETPVKSALILKGETLIVDPKQFADPHLNLWGTSHFSELGINHYKGLTDMYQITAKAGGSYEMTFSEAKDFSNRQALALYFNYASEKGEALSFSLEFQDADGQVEQIHMSSQLPFNYGAGSLIPFYQERILLETLQVIDLTSVISLTFHFPTAIDGEFNLGGLSLSGYKDAPAGKY